MRCAIYTRKSNTDGLELPFNSLHAQRDVCANYIRSQAPAGWSIVESAYDDGGYTGGTLDRPGLDQLLSDVDAGAIDCVVVYKIDRLSRSLRDFLNLLARLELRSVSFVSVTQHFDTSTSMGRLTLNMLLSFAQFEREVTSDRVKDKQAASVSKGLWVFGRPPYGYSVERNLLIVEPAEAAVVEKIFAAYIKQRSIAKACRALHQQGLRNRDGNPFSHNIVGDMISNRIYLGEMRYKRRHYPGIHTAIIADATWHRAEILRVKNDNRGHRRAATLEIPLLRGIAFGPNDRLLTHVFSHRPMTIDGVSTVHRYYFDLPYKPGKPKPELRFRARELEMAVVGLLDRFCGLTETAARTASDIRQLLVAMVERIDVSAGSMRVKLKAGATVDAPLLGQIFARVARKDWQPTNPTGPRAPIMLRGILFRDDGAPMQHLYEVSGTRRSRRYKDGSYRPGAVRPTISYRAASLEGEILAVVTAHISPPKPVAEGSKRAIDLIRKHVERVTLSGDKTTILLKDGSQHTFATESRSRYRRRISPP